MIGHSTMSNDYAHLGQGLDSVLVAAEEAGRKAQISDLATREITPAFYALAVIALIRINLKQVRSCRSGI